MIPFCLNKNFTKKSDFTKKIFRAKDFKKQKCYLTDGYRDLMAVTFFADFRNVPKALIIKPPRKKNSD